MNKKKYICAAILLLILALVLCLIFRACGRTDDNPTLTIDDYAVEWDGNQLLPQASPGTKGIVIPGFDSLTFTANQTTQAVNFHNPAENENRLFLMMLYVEDDLLWQSGYVPAGKGYYKIDLEKPLVAGDYQAYLRILVYTEDAVQLNGAKIEFDLHVQEANQ